MSEGEGEGSSPSSSTSPPRPARTKSPLRRTLKFLEFKIEEKLSFVEYLKKGWFINLSVAIDFTASNGELHDINENPDELNDY